MCGLTVHQLSWTHAQVFRQANCANDENSIMETRMDLLVTGILCMVLVCSLTSPHRIPRVSTVRLEIPKASRRFQAGPLFSWILHGTRVSIVRG